MRFELFEVALAHLPEQPVDLEGVVDVILELRVFSYSLDNHLHSDDRAGSYLYL